MFAKISSRLVVALAVIAAITATGFAVGYKMQPWIVGYWTVLTAKNICDYIAIQVERMKKLK